MSVRPGGREWPDNLLITEAFSVSPIALLHRILS